MPRKLKGLAASKGTYTGRARIIRNPRDLDAFQPGEILVANETCPDYVSAFALAGAVVTARGGILCHAAIVAREHKLPAVVGVPNLLQHVQDGQVMTVFGGEGWVQL